MKKALLAAALLPKLAAACPACVGQPRPSSTLWLVGLFMLFPFAVFFILLKVVRGALRE